MTRVEISGFGLHPFGRFDGKSAADLVSVAVSEALRSANLGPKDIDAVFCGHSLPTSGGGTEVVRECGISGVPVYNIDAACASSTMAMSLGISGVASDQFDRVLVVGYEKMGRGMLRSARPLDPFGDQLGLETQPAQYALKANWYLDTYSASAADLASVAVKSRRQASLNPNAHLRNPTTIREVLESPVIADPLTRFQCCPTSDGAAAIVLQGRRSAAHRAVAEVRACAVTSGSHEHGADGAFTDVVSRSVARDAYEAAGLGPTDVNVAQVHDAFTSGEVLRIEALGLVPEGEGAQWSAAGRTSSLGDMPVNTDGGLLSRGHPLGATGVAQVIELVMQLTGVAGQRQVNPQPRVAIAQNTGGGENAATVVTILSV